LPISAEGELQKGWRRRVCSQSDILGPASCRKQPVNVAKDANVATPHNPAWPAGTSVLQ
jgi:hypothetical protein